jgi:O-antigen ligase
VHLAQAHNDYLQVLVEGGLLVAVPVAIALGLLAFAIRRSVNEARGDSYDYWVRAGATVGLVAMGIQETVEFSLQMPANAFLFATLAAMAVCPVRKTSRRAQSMSPTSPMRSPPLREPSI